MSEFIYYIFDYLISTFQNGFINIYHSYSFDGSVSKFSTNNFELSGFDFVCQFLSKLIIFVVIIFLFYLLYKLIIFIVRRFINV